MAMSERGRQIPGLREGESIVVIKGRDKPIFGTVVSEPGADPVVVKRSDETREYPRDLVLEIITPARSTPAVAPPKARAGASD